MSFNDNEAVEKVSSAHDPETVQAVGVGIFLIEGVRFLLEAQQLVAVDLGPCGQGRQQRGDNHKSGQDIHALSSMKSARNDPAPIDPACKNECRHTGEGRCPVAREARRC